MKNRVYIYKQDGSEYVDVSNFIEKLSLDKGSVMETGDSYADNPVETLSVTLKNTNSHLFSPHFKQGKIKYNNSFDLNLLLNVHQYDLPNEFTLDLYTDSTKYTATLLNNKIDIYPTPNQNETIKIYYSFIDITVLNPLNHIFTAKTFYELCQYNFNDLCQENFYDLNIGAYNNYNFSPLISEKARLIWWQDDEKYLYYNYGIYGNGTNQITINNTNELVSLELLYNLLTTGQPTFYELCQENFYDLCQDNFFELCIGNNSAGSSLNMVSYVKVENVITVTFDRIIPTAEYLLLSAVYIDTSTSYLKFDGYISGNVESDVETCSFSCKDRSLDLQNAKIEGMFRTYDSSQLDDNSYEVLEESIKLSITSKSASTTYNNYTDYFNVGDEIRLYNGTDYLINTISTVSTNAITFVDDIEDGVYTHCIRYTNGIPMPLYFQKCLDDCGIPYTLYIDNPNTFAVLPKEEDMQQDDLWNHFQDIVLKSGNIIHFKNINNVMELVLEKIPLTLGTSKYTITENDIYSGVNFSLDSTNIRTSFALNFQKLENGTYTTIEKVKDDFIQSLNAITIGTESNLINTDELLTVGKWIRINNDYYKVIETITSSVYRLNKNVTVSTSYILYTQGQYTDRYDLKTASITYDNTSQINTDSEADTFLDLLLYQNLEPIQTFKITLNANKFRLENFDTITVTSPRLGLFNEKVFVQSVAEDYSNDSKTITITIAIKMSIGKYKYKEMITERGNNTITTSSKLSTSEVFPPPQSLKAYEPAIDDLNNYVVYSKVEWNDMIGKNVIQWELQYSTDSTFTTCETITTNTTSLKLVLKEQKLYYIRVRGVGKEQVKGKWAETTVDASLFLIDNPIQNRTWYIRLFEGNDDEEYFNRFDTLGYTNQYIIDNIDTIEIVPNSDKGIKTTNYVQWKKNKFTTYPNRIETGIEKSIIDRTSDTPNKNLYFNSVPNGYYKFEGDYISGSGGLYGSLNTKLFKNIKGVNGNVIFRPFNSIKTLENRDSDFGDLREVSDFTVICYQSDNVGLDCRAVDEYYADKNNARITYKNIKIETHNYTTGITIGFTSNKLENCICEDFGSVSIGFYRSNLLKNCKSINCDIGFQECYNISYNNAVNCTTKYDTCYASSDNSVAIPTNGSDTAQFGWNV